MTLIRLMRVRPVIMVEDGCHKVAIWNGYGDCWMFSREVILEHLCQPPFEWNGYSGFDFPMEGEKKDIMKKLVTLAEDCKNYHDKDKETKDWFLSFMNADFENEDEFPDPLTPQ